MIHINVAIPSLPRIKKRDDSLQVHPPFHPSAAYPSKQSARPARLAARRVRGRSWSWSGCGRK